MILENKLNLDDQASLARAEEEISKRKAKQLFDSGDIHQVEVGTTTTKDTPPLKPTSCDE